MYTLGRFGFVLFSGQGRRKKWWELVGGSMQKKKISRNKRKKKKEEKNNVSFLQYFIGIKVRSILFLFQKCWNSIYTRYMGFFKSIDVAFSVLSSLISHALMHNKKILVHCWWWLFEKWKKSDYSRKLVFFSRCQIFENH